MQIEEIVEIIKNYLKGLEEGNYEKVINLFSDTAIVYSPLYGKIKAKAFYQELFKDTSKSRITLQNIFISQNNPQIAAAYFIYEWTLKENSSASFECVDVFRFDETGKIVELKIIYDTFKIRKSFEDMKK